MCVACRTHRPQRALVRITKPKDGDATIATAYTPGRSAYLCRDAACVNKAIKGRRLEYALKCRISDEVKTALEVEAALLDIENIEDIDKR